MDSISQIHLDMLGRVVSSLTPSLREQIVFVGGCTTCLFVDEISQTDIRSTEDVDLIISVLSHSEYMSFQNELKQCGFKELGLEDEEGPICRMKLGETVIDLMPTEASVLGFQNNWYPIAFESAEDYSLNGHMIKLIHPVYFLATKFEAYNNRGDGDLLGSKDIEDIFIVVNGRSRLYEEIYGFNIKNQKVVSFIQEQFRSLMRHSYYFYKIQDYPNVDEKVQRILDLP